MSYKEINLTDIEGIPENVAKELSELDRDPYETRLKMWEPWQDKVLITMWHNVARKKDLAKTLNRSVGACRERYRKLVVEKMEVENIES